MPDFKNERQAHYGWGLPTADAPKVAPTERSAKRKGAPWWLYPFVPLVLMSAVLLATSEPTPRATQPAAVSAESVAFEKENAVIETCRDLGRKRMPRAKQAWLGAAAKTTAGGDIIVQIDVELPAPGGSGWMDGQWRCVQSAKTGKVRAWLAQ